jgi:hypothetical protein|tara:strand:+ start:1427 stop:1756 length:330 start_codon:yes stop_codon:yes gene_type:complete
MSRLIDKAVTHFDAKAMRELRVVEWDNTTIYAKNLTKAEISKCRSMADESDDNDLIMTFLVYSVVDEKGERLFDVGDKQKLKTSVDPKVIDKVADFVLNLSSQEEIEGN